MTDYEIQGPARVCAATGRELKPGDRFHAVLAEQDGKLVRTDFAAEAWPGAPEGAIAHWTGKVPASDKPRRPVINDDVLLGCFERLKEAADENGRNFRYVAALLLMRKKRFRFEDVSRDPASGHDVMILKDSKGGAVHEVIDPRLTDEQIGAVQTELFRVLGWE
ncbi:MAG TPA: hypothetical protein VLM40_08735 [Gemmata sp.]|nr:hypothetical protein [Gemmata sp.]